MNFENLLKFDEVTSTFFIRKTVELKNLPHLRFVATVPCEICVCVQSTVVGSRQLMSTELIVTLIARNRSCAVYLLIVTAAECVVALLPLP